eukprot:8225777-Pyramimonas_sp.AAC.2
MAHCRGAQNPPTLDSHYMCKINTTRGGGWGREAPLQHAQPRADDDDCACCRGTIRVPARME